MAGILTEFNCLRRLERGVKARGRAGELMVSSIRQVRGHLSVLGMAFLHRLRLQSLSCF